MMTLLNKTYVGLGGNIGDTYSILLHALNDIGSLKGISDLEVSQFYITSPLSSIPQDHYLNAVCSFNTEYSVRQLMLHLQEIEKKLGKLPKQKDEPRVIDLDIIFFGREVHQDSDLEIPHPRWDQRLFVLIPLLDLVQEIWIDTKKINLQSHLKKIQNRNQECVLLYCARLGSEDLGFARQSQIEASVARGLQEEHHSHFGKGDDKDRFGKVAASPNLQNLTARIINS